MSGEPTRAGDHGSHTHLFQVALAPALLCWVSPPVVPPLSPPPPPPPPPPEVFACERSVRLEEELLPNLSLLWRVLEIQKTEREK
ncbi:hypothetical protein EYF80_067645 [Liparis tanakae]|uniref:Uncharacterized protein n=1 Tax=Liparis tanakae TaxID=230148 RepID=A0A4Z2E0C1_9TELE|nr:hypothetical protein EYF80_067645 [Liparis tanakae]